MVGFVIYCVLSNFLFTACIQSNKNPIANNDRSENYKSTFLFCCATHNSRVTFICTIFSTEWLPMPTDYEHPERVFFLNPKILGMGRQIGPKILGAFGVSATYSTHLGVVSPLSMVLSIWLFFLQNTLVFRTKTYKSQINPKYDNGRKLFLWKCEPFIYYDLIFKACILPNP